MDLILDNGKGAKIIYFRVWHKVTKYTTGHFLDESIFGSKNSEKYFFLIAI